MAKRHIDALGIAHAIIEACTEARLEPGFTGTQALCSDPAIRLMVNQLAYVVGLGEMNFDDFARR